MRNYWQPRLFILIIKIILPAIIVFGLLQIHSIARAESNIVSAPISISDGLKDAKFYNAYKKVFQSFFGIKWVKEPILEDSVKSMKSSNKNNVTYSIYFSCKPHSCNSEKLVFVYNPINGYGWGKLKIDSETNDFPIEEEIESIIINQMRN